MTGPAFQYHWVIPLLGALADLWLTILVYSHDRKNPVHQTFTLMSFTLVLWSLDIFSLDFASSAEQALFWSRLFRIGMLLMPPTILHFALVFSDRNKGWLRAVLVCNYVVAFALVVANAFNLLVARVQQLGWGYYPRPEPLYAVHTASFVINALLASVVFAEACRSHPSARRRLQARFWLLALAIAALLGLTNLLAVYGVPVYPLGSLANVAYTAIIAYAILEHRLMDIDLVVTKGAAYVAAILVLVTPAFVLLLWLQRVTFGRLNPDFSLAVLMTLVLIGILFPTLRVQVEARLEQSLFRERHEYRRALAAFTRSIVRILDRQRLINEITSTLSEVLHLDRLAIVLLGEDRHNFSLEAVVGPTPTVTAFSERDPFIDVLARQQHCVLRDEAEVSADPTARAMLASVCRQNGWEVCVPLATGGGLIGFIALGRKGQVEAFSAGDLDLLETLAAEASVALENARLYEELRKSQEIIRRADRLSALGTLAAGIAHEIRNPLVSIQTFFQLAPERLHDEEFLNTFLGMTANEVKRISDLITELLSFARSPTRTLGPVNLNETVERVLKLLEPEARKHKLTLTHTLAPAVPVVRADADQVKQVLINLVLNAIQATEPGGSITLLTRSVRRREAPFGQLEVRDTGTGIPADRLDHIFDPFFTTKEKGTGLGLAIAHQIVAEHGGAMSVESTEGSGTSFFVDLPAFQPGAAAEAADASAGAELAATYPRSRRAAS